MMRISVVIITHNRVTELKKCLNSILKQTLQAHEIIVLDNASSDETCEVLTKQFPLVRLIKSNINLGIPAGRNLGYRQASGEICVTVDDDAILKSDFSFERIVNYFNADEKLGCISFLVEDGDTGKISKKFIPRRDRKIPEADGLGASFVGTGHAIKRGLFIRLGGFWEKLGLYFGEEPDLSYRILESGYLILHTTSVIVKHYESTNSRPAGRRIYHGARNTPWIALKNLPWYSCISLTILAWGYYFVQAIRYRLLRSYIKGVFDSIMGIRSVINQRKCVSKETRELLRCYSGVYWY